MGDVVLGQYGQRKVGKYNQLSFAQPGPRGDLGQMLGNWPFQSYLSSGYGDLSKMRPLRLRPTGGGDSAPYRDKKSTVCPNIRRIGSELELPDFVDPSAQYSNRTEGIRG